MTKDPKVIVALDFDRREDVAQLLSQLNPEECRVKVGKELFTRFGPDMVKTIHDLGFQVFLDLKFHDIPETVKKACQAAASLGVWMLNVHALGGKEMLLAAKAGIEHSGNSPKLIAVTILTSSSKEDIYRVGLSGGVAENVNRLTTLAYDAGLDGVVCSAKEANELRRITGAEFLLVSPGIRPAGASYDDQKRVLTPPEAVRCGANYLVIGRPITRAENPAEVLAGINAELNNV